MDQETLRRSRLSLHGIAELVLAGAQYAKNGEIRLRVTPGGFGTITAPHLRVDGLELVTPTARLPLGGTFDTLARAAGVEARPLRDVYAENPGVSPDDPIDVDPEAVTLILRAFSAGHTALRAFAPDEEPVLWPEHFDIGITLADVNYGVTAGDSHVPDPYAYVGPWTPREGTFWNTPFGAAVPLRELPNVDAVLAFFHDGAERATADPPRLPRHQS